MDSQGHMSWCFVFNGVRLEVIVRFVDIVDHHCFLQVGYIIILYLFNCLTLYVFTPSVLYQL